MNRRQLLVGTAASLALLKFSGAKAALNSMPQKGKLNMVNLHTGERFNDVFREAGTYVPDALEELQVVLRDHRTGDTHPIDPQLFDWMASLKSRLGGSEFAIISGYRSPKTNAMLRSNSNGVAKRSKHMDGKAIDLRLSGVDTSRLRKLAINDQRGGVGYYAKSDFVHLDTGRPRFW